MPWRLLLLLLLGVAPACARGYLVDTHYASGGRWSGSYVYHETKLSRAEDGGWTVELSEARYKGPKPHVSWPILILGVRVHLPAQIEEGRVYAVADPDEDGPGACVVELGYPFIFSCTWLPVGPGRLRVTCWNPERGYLAARFELRDPRAGEGGEDIRVYAGSFDAWR